MLFGDRLRSQTFLCPAHAKTAPSAHRLGLHAARVVVGSHRARFHQHRLGSPHGRLALAACTPGLSRHARRRFLLESFWRAFVGRPQDGTSGGVRRVRTPGGPYGQGIVPGVFVRPYSTDLMEDGCGRSPARPARSLSRRAASDLGTFPHGGDPGRGHRCSRCVGGSPGDMADWPKAKSRPARRNDLVPWNLARSVSPYAGQT